MDNPSGEFETHVTVAPTEKVDQLRSWAAERLLKFTHIILSQGETSSQPMLTFHGNGSLESQIQIANNLASDLAELGCPSNRIKVEACLTNTCVPADDEWAKREREDRYFEFHVKLELSMNGDLNELSRVAIGHDAHLSRNAFRTLENGIQERFVTQRGYGIGLDTATERFAKLLNALKQLGYKVLEIEKEYVVHDSNLSVDSGWMDRRGHKDVALGKIFGKMRT